MSTDIDPILGQRHRRLKQYWANVILHSYYRFANAVCIAGVLRMISYYSTDALYYLSIF